MSDIPSTTPAPTSPGGAPSNPAPTPSAPATSGASSNGSTSTQTSPTEGLKRQVTPDTPTTPPQAADRPQTDAVKEARRKEVQRLKLKLKVDGEEIEEELDEHEIATRLQKARAADKRFQEAARRTKEINELIQKGKESPEALLEYLGINPKEYAERLIAQDFELSQMTPEQRELEEYKRRVQEFEAREAQTREAQERQRREEHERQVFEQTEQEFVTALEELGYEDRQFERSVLLPLMADIALVNEQNGVGLTPQQLARAAENRLNAIAKRPLASLKGEKLLKFVGDAAVKEIIRASLEKRQRAAQNAPAPTPPPTPPPPAPTERKPRERGNFFLEHVIMG